MTEHRRPCSKCNKNRAERFFVSPRGRVCLPCQNGRVKLATRGTRLEETYGITEDEYRQLLAAQNGGCAICAGKRTGNLDVDHDHALEKLGRPKRECVRGLLCRRCNRRLLPASTDSRAVLLAALRYLEFPPAQAVLRAAMARTDGLGAS